MAAILIIEDDAAVRFNMVSYLEDSGFAVSDEGDGTRGMEVARASRGQRAHRNRHENAPEKGGTT